VAATRRLAGEGTGVVAADIDLIGAAGADGVLWRHEGFGLAGRGVAMRIELAGGLADRAAVARVAASLAEIEPSGDVTGPGTGAVALGALPFLREAPGVLIVPRVLIGRRDDEAWLTTITAASDASSAMELAETMISDALGGYTDNRPPPSEFTLTSVMDHGAWSKLVSDAIARIGDGAFGKVVLSRQVAVRANRPFVTSDVLSRLSTLYPTCVIFRMDDFLGASPELLIERRGARVVTHPLAGTIGRSGDLVTDEALVAGLLASPKQRREHAFVIDDLRRTLGPVCDCLEVPDKPTVLELRNVTHLATEMSGVLLPASDRPGQVPTALDLVARVHPTPAIGGTPTDAAVAYIREVEGYDRGRYSGPVGWVDAHGDGSWVIGLRSAEVTGDRGTLYAGVGLVAGSRPGSELEETQLKLQALLAAMVRP